MGCVIMIAILIVGVIWAKVAKLGSFAVVDASATQADERGYDFSPGNHIRMVDLPSRIRVRCEECKNEWEPKVVANLEKWDDRPPAELDDPEMAPFAIFKPSMLEAGHAGLQPTEATFRVVCPKCSYKGDVLLRNVKKLIKNKGKKA
jgi:hypothetical protein